MLHWFMQHINMNQPQVCVWPLPLTLPSHLLPHPTSPGCHRAPDLSFLHHTANSHCLSDFTYSSRYVSTLLSVCPTLSSHCVCKSVLCIPLLLCRWLHQCYLISLHYGHHQMVNIEIRLIIFFAAKDGEALYSQQKQDQELTVAQTMNSLLLNSDFN